MAKWQHKKSVVEAWQFMGRMPTQSAPKWVQQLCEEGKIEQSGPDVLTVRLFAEGIDICNKEDFIVRDELGNLSVGRRGVFDDQYEEVA